MRRTGARWAYVAGLQFLIAASVLPSPHAAAAAAHACAQREFALRSYLEDVWFPVWHEACPPAVDRGALDTTLVSVERQPNTPPAPCVTQSSPWIVVSPAGIRLGRVVAFTRWEFAAALEARDDDLRSLGRWPDGVCPVVLLTPDAPLGLLEDVVRGLLDHEAREAYIAFDVAPSYLPSRPPLLDALRGEAAQAGFPRFLRSCTPRRTPFELCRDDDGPGFVCWMRRQFRDVRQACPALAIPDTYASLPQDGTGAALIERWTRGAIECGCRNSEERFLALTYYMRIPEHIFHFHPVRLSPSAAPLPLPPDAPWRAAAPLVLERDELGGP